MNKELIITAELCKQYDKGEVACEDGIDFLQSNYPAGFTVKEVYDGKAKIPMEFIHWGYVNLPFSDEEKEMYLKYAKIKDSTGFFLSESIENCFLTSRSTNCKNSKKTLNSHYVNDSYLTIGSKFVWSSAFTYDSTEIVRSYYSVNSEFIEDSHTNLLSKNIKNSSATAFCTRASSCSFIVGCMDVENCLLSRELDNCKNKIFCNQLKDNDDFMIFNERVSEATFNLIKKELESLLRQVKFEAFDFIDNDNLNEIQVINIQSIFTIFNSTFNNAEIWEKFKRILPNFNEVVAYDITNSSFAFSYPCQHGDPPGETGEPGIQ